MGDRNRLVGVLLVLLSAFAWSLNGLYTRFLTVDLWTTLVGRAIATSAMLLLALLLIRGRDAGRILTFNIRRGGIVIVAGAITMLSFVAALFNTTVANVTVIYSVSPLIAAVLARILIGDQLVARTLVAFAFAFGGIVIMVSASLGSDRLFGDLLALVMSAGFAVVIVEMRRKPDIDNVSTSMLASLLTLLVLAPFASFGDITPTDALVLFLFGFTSNILGFFLFIAAVRRMPPAEAGLIATVEVILAPFWVWLFFAEDPGAATVAGGAIVLGAVVFQLAGELRRKPGATIVSAGGVPAKVEKPAEVL